MQLKFNGKCHKKENKIMGASIMFALAIIIATAAVLYYWRQDRKEKKNPKAE